MQNKDAYQAKQDNQSTEVVLVPSMMVDIHTGEIVSKSINHSDEVIEVITDSNQQRYIIFVSSNPNQEKRKRKWFQYIEKLTGWKIKFFDSFPDLPFLFLDKEKKQLYINSEVFKSGFKEFMNIIDKLVTLLSKQSAEAYQSVTKALNRINSQRTANKVACILMKVTEQGLQFPADFLLQASDLQAYVVSVDNELIIKTASFRMIATGTTELPLTAETTLITFDETGFICPLQKNILDKLSGHSELEFTVEDIEN